MKQALALVLLASAGCRGYATPQPEQVTSLLKQVPAEASPFVRLKVRLSLDSPSLAGVFDGAIVVRTGIAPAVRAQFYPDLGGKAIDLLATPGRITGLFPLQNEGLDIALPGEARLHPLALIGVTILEHAATLTAGRVTGVRDDWYLVDAAAPGVALAIHPEGDRLVRKFGWKYGVRWTETSTAAGSVVYAPNLTVHLEVLERTRVDALPESLFRLELPPDVRR